MYKKIMVLDTGAGPNCVSSKALPVTMKERMRPPPAFGVHGAGGKRLTVTGQVVLALRLADQLVKATFIVCDGLQVDFILGTDFIDRHVRSIQVEERHVRLKNGSELPILRSSFAELFNRSSSEVVPPPDKKPKGKSISGKIRVAKPTTLPPLSQTWVHVRSMRRGAIVVEPLPSLTTSHMVSASNGVAHIQPNVPFRILVANFGEKPVRLRRDMVIAHAFPHPTAVFDTPLKLVDVFGIEVEDAPSSVNEQHNVVATKRANSAGREAPTQRETLADQDTSVLTELKKSKSVEDIPLSDVDKRFHKEIRDMLRKHASMWDGHLGEIKATEHRIEVDPEAKPIRQNPYRAGLKERQFAREQIDKLLTAGVISPSDSEWASPVVLAPKADGSLRFCIDYRRLNAVTRRDSYPIPRMDDCMDTLGSANIFSTLDANWGYWQLPVREQDRKYTAFSSHEGLFEFNRLPFGLTNAPASFQRALDVILARFKWKTCLIYLDDIIVFSRDVESHIDHVDQILSVLRHAGISLKIDKCDFFTKTVKYLGHIVRPGTLEVDRARTLSLQRMKLPRTLTELRSFLGMVNVYRKFIRDYTSMAHPLYGMLKNQPKESKQVELPQLNSDQVAAFNQLKEALVNPPVLALPKPGLRYSLDTDASAYQVGCALFQTQANGDRKPIGYWSRTLNSAERNYTATERECLAVVYGITTCRPYLFGGEFDLYTDHSALRWLMQIVDPSGRLMRWRLRLAEYKFLIHHKKGKLHCQADALSRVDSEAHTQSHEDMELPCYVIGYETTVDHQLKTLGDGKEPYPFTEEPMTIMDVLMAQKEDELELPAPISIEEIVEAQARDEFCQSIRSALERGERVAFRDCPESGMLERVFPDHTALVVPVSLQPRLLMLAHQPQVAGHPGGRKMYQTLRRQYYWPGLALDCYQTVRSCAHCARERIRLQQNASQLQLFPAVAPLEDIAMDILGELWTTKRGNKYLLVINDRCTKLVRTIPMRGITALDVAKAFCTHWAFAYGMPRTVLMDRGPQLASKFLQEVFRAMGVKAKYTTTYHPKANGQTERFNRTILSGLRKYIGDHPDDWDLYSDALTYSYNTQVHASTGFAPFELVLSRVPPDLVTEGPPSEQRSSRELREQWLLKLQEHMFKYKQALRSSQERYKANFDRRLRRRRKNVKAGGFVFVRVEKISLSDPRRTHKLAPIASGPFRVVEVRPHTVVIEHNDIREEVSLDRVEPAPPPLESSDVVEQPTQGAESTTNAMGQRTNEDEMYVVDRLLKHRQLKERPSGHFEYLVKWIGHDTRTWEPAANLRRNMVVRYHRRKKLALPPNLGEAMND